MAANGGKVTLWCVGIGEKQKRSHDDDSEQEPTRKRSKPSDSSVDSLISQAMDYEVHKHSDTYTPLQYKLWAEMYAKGGHNSLDDPPRASVFNCKTKPQTRSAHDQ